MNASPAPGDPEAQHAAAGSRFTKRQHQLQYAKRYAEFGWPAFLCEPGAKVPLQSGGFHNATTDAAMLQAQWREHPRANVALRTGPGFWVLDVDPKNGGDTALQALQDRYGPLPDTLRARTPSGGEHWYFAADSRARNTTSKLGPGLDTRGHGGYVLAEGSTVGGSRYGFLDFDPLEDDPPPLAPAPEWLIKLAFGNKRDERTHGTDDKIPSSQRNDTLSRRAFGMRKGGLCVEAIKAALLAENRARCDPPLGDAEVRAIARGKARIEPDERVPGGAHIGRPADLLQHAFWIRDARFTLDLPYIIKGVVSRGQILVMWAAPGDGKTFVAMEMNVAVGSGQRFHGRRTKRGPCLYVAAESSRPHIENRIAALRQEWPEAADADVLIVPLALDLLHAEAGDVDRVIAAAKQLEKERGEVALITLDTLAVTFGGGDENSSVDMGRYVANVKRIIAETGAAVLIVHHTGKDEARGMRGHSALLGALDAELAIEKAEGGERILRTGKVREGESFTDLFAFTLRPVELGTDADGDPVRTCVVEVLGDAGLAKARRSTKGLGKNQRAIVDVLTQRGSMARPELVKLLRDEHGFTASRAQHSITDLLTREGIRNLHGILTLE